MAVDPSKLAQVEFITEIADAAGTPSWETLYDITGAVDPDRPNETKVYPVQGEPLATSHYVGGDKATLSFSIEPFKTGTRREGFDILQAAHKNRTIVLVRTFFGPKVNGTLYHQSAYVVKNVKLKASLADSEAYDVTLERTIYSGFADERYATWSA